jgi:hypothetical protein
VDAVDGQTQELILLQCTEQQSKIECVMVIVSRSSGANAHQQRNELCGE